MAVLMMLTMLVFVAVRLRRVRMLVRVRSGFTARMRVLMSLMVVRVLV